MIDEYSQTSDDKSTSSREETNSSGYVSEGSNETKTEEKDELLQTSEITVNIDEKKSEDRKVDTEESRDGKDKLKVETEESKTIKQSPVPKPPRLGTQNSARLDPQAYINFEIEPTEKEKADEANQKQDIAQNENVEPSTDIKVQNNKPEHKTSRHETQNKTRLKTSSLENVKKDENTNQLDKRTTSTLPSLPPTDKRKAPEPPDVTTKKKASEKGTKKGECHLNFVVLYHSVNPTQLAMNDKLTSILS